MKMKNIPHEVWTVFDSVRTVTVVSLI